MEQMDKKLVKCFVFLAYFGAIIISFEIIRGTYLFIINDVFSVDFLYAFILFYGYLFGGLVLMAWIVKNRDLLERKILQKKKKRATE